MRTLSSAAEREYRYDCRRKLKDMPGADEFFAREGPTEEVGLGEEPEVVR